MVKYILKVVVIGVTLNMPMMVGASTSPEDPVILAGGSSSTGSLERRIEELERTLQDMKSELRRQAEATAEAKQTAEEVKQAAEMAPTADKDKHSLIIYASLRPRLTYIDVDGTGAGGTSTDVTDGLSRVGIKGSSKISEALTALYVGEWDVDIEDDGDFGDARQAYVGLHHSQLGRLAIGKQWDPHINIIGEVTDIYNHRGSPFGYDNVGPFRTNNLVTYRYTNSGFKMELGLQVNGDQDSSNLRFGTDDDDYYKNVYANDGDEAGGNNARGDNIDAFSVGGGYNFEVAQMPTYLGVSYLKQKRDVDASTGASTGERRFIGVGGSIRPMDPLYLAFTWQDVENKKAGVETSLDTLDILAAYTFAEQYTAKVGYFDAEEAYDGYTVTLENQLNDNMRVYLEWVRFQQDSDVDTDNFSLGFRYNFEKAVF